MRQRDRQVNTAFFSPDRDVWDDNKRLLVTVTRLQDLLSLAKVPRVPNFCYAQIIEVVQ